MTLDYKVYYTDGETRIFRANSNEWEIHKEILEDHIKIGYVEKYEIIRGRELR